MKALNTSYLNPSGSWGLGVLTVALSFCPDFAYSQVSGTSYRIVTTCGSSGKVLSVAKNSLSNEASIVLSTKDNRNQAQIFKLVAAGGAYKVVAQNSSKVWDIPGSSKADGAKLIQYDANGGSNQSFLIQKASDGSYRFQNVNSKKYVDLSNQSTKDGNPLIQWTSNTGCAQKFKLEAVSTVTPPPPAQPPTPTQPPPPPADGAYTTIEKVFADMFNTSEAIPIDPRFDWQKQSQIIMAAPRGDAIPSWFPYSKPTWMYEAISWFVLQEAQGNKAINSRVEVVNLRMYFLSESTRKWIKMDSSAVPFTDTWQYPFDFSSPSNVGNLLRPVYPKFYHGYGHTVKINPQDVRATFTAMEFRLVLIDPNKTDDRALARYVLEVGGDYWPGNGAGQDWTYAPGMGSGRFLLAKPNWNTATMIVPNPTLGATMDELKANPPPLAP